MKKNKPVFFYPRMCRQLTADFILLINILIYRNFTAILYKERIILWNWSYTTCYRKKMYEMDTILFYRKHFFILREIIKDIFYEYVVIERLEVSFITLPSFIVS